MKNKNIEQNKSALKWLLKSVDAKTLLAFFKNKSNGELVDIGGFRMNVDSFSKPMVLVKLTNALAKDHKRFNLLLRDESMPWNAYIELINAIDEDWITEHINELFNVLGDRHLLVALEADKRPGVNKLAIPFWENSDIWTKEVVKKEDRKLLSIFKPLGFSDGIQEPITTHNNNQEVEKLKKIIDTDKQKQHDLISEKKEESKRLELEIQLLKKDHKSKITEEKQKSKILENQIIELHKNTEVRINKAVDQYKNDILQFSVSEEEQKLDRTAFASAEQLIVAVDKRLASHIAHNKKHGTYSRIRQQITDLEKTLAKVNYCLIESILVDHELVELKSELQKKIQTLQSLPKIRNNFETEVDKYTELINQLPLVHTSLDRLADFNTIFQNPEITILFGTKPDGLAKLIADKKARIETILAEKSLANLIPLTDKNTYITNIKKMLSGKKHPFYCIIDGCNVMLSHSYKNGFKEESSISHLRQHLKMDCEKVSSDWEQIVIAYDSQSTTGNIETSGNIETVFVDKLTEDQNADNYIIRRLKALNQKQIQPSQICLVTADRDLQIRAKAYCKNVVSTENFVSYLLG